MYNMHVPAIETHINNNFQLNSVVISVVHLLFDTLSNELQPIQQDFTIGMHTYAHTHTHTHTIPIKVYSSYHMYISL